MAQRFFCRLILAGAKYPRQSIVNPSTQEAIRIYRADKNYSRFYHNFLIESDNDRSSL
jgi:hypothetical protein